MEVANAHDGTCDADIFCRQQFAHPDTQRFYEACVVGRTHTRGNLYFYQKRFWSAQRESALPTLHIVYSLLISLVIGFYDGFIGPGAGSFLVLAFVVLMGYDFLHASANAKMVNLATNFGSILLFVLKGKIIWAIAIPMALCNAAGGFTGAKLAINKGNKFIRVFFLIIVVGTLIRFAYDIFFKS